MRHSKAPKLRVAEGRLGCLVRRGVKSIREIVYFYINAVELEAVSGIENHQRSTEIHRM